MAIEWQTLVIGVLLSIIGFFLKVGADALKENTKILTQLVTKFEVMNTVIDTIKRDNSRSSEVFSEAISRQEHSIEMLRGRTHFLIGKITVIRLKMEVAGMKFAGEDWTLPIESDYSHNKNG